MPDPAACADLLNQMPAGDLWRGFGLEGSEKVDYRLPYQLREFSSIIRNIRSSVFLHFLFLTPLFPNFSSYHIKKTSKN